MKHIETQLKRSNLYILGARCLPEPGKIDAIPEALSDGVEGFLVPPGQKWRMVYAKNMPAIICNMWICLWTNIIPISTISGHCQTVRWCWCHWWCCAEIVPQPPVTQRRCPVEDRWFRVSLSLQDMYMLLIIDSRLSRSEKLANCEFNHQMMGEYWTYIVDQ